MNNALYWTSIVVGAVVFIAGCIAMLGYYAGTLIAGIACLAVIAIGYGLVIWGLDGIEGRKL